MKDLTIGRYSLHYWRREKWALEAGFYYAGCCGALEWAGQIGPFRWCVYSTCDCPADWEGN